MELTTLETLILITGLCLFLMLGVNNSNKKEDKERNKETKNIRYYRGYGFIIMTEKNKHEH